MNSQRKLNFFKKSLKSIKKRPKSCLFLLLVIVITSITFFNHQKPNHEITQQSTEEIQFSIKNNQGEVLEDTKIKTKENQVSINNPSFNLNLEEVQNPSKEIPITIGEPQEEISEQELKLTIEDFKTPIISVGHNLKFKTAQLELTKNHPDQNINAILTCTDYNFDPEKFNCKDWEITPIKIKDQGDKIAFNVEHFSSYVGVYLEIVNLQSNLTQGDIWETRFNTYGQSTLTIEAVDGTEYPRDITLEGIYCGDTQLQESEYTFQDQTITIENYSCDQTSKIRNQTITGGRHWLAFSFGDTFQAKAHNFACDSGTLDDTCYVSTAQTMSNGDVLSGTGNLVIQNGGNLTTANTETFGIKLDGDITIESGGTITGNLTNDITGDAIGTGDDTTTVFNTTYYPITADSETVYVDGVAQILSTDTCSTNDYTINLTTGAITFCSAPVTGLAITVDYSYTNATNLTINSGGSINVDKKGYTGGAPGVAGNGPGGGEGSGGLGGGGSYGGDGGDVYYNEEWTYGGIAYGSITNPDDFGSGGGGMNYYTNANYGDGGGLLD
jgi:hypothetical protein